MNHEDLNALPPTIDVETAGQILGLSRPSAYAAAHAFLETGHGIPALRFGRRLRVPTAQLLDLIGVDPRAEAEAGDGL